MFRLAAVYALLFACMTGVIGCATQDGVVDTSDFTRRTQSVAAKQAAELEPGDSIEISVEVDGRVEVPLHRSSLNFNGIATLPLVGDVKIGGLNLNIARAVIAKRYGALYVSKPLIMISLVDDKAVSEWGQVRVLGRVNRPGTVPLTTASGMNLSAAIQEAGGFATSAKTTEIQVTRPSSSGKKLRVVVNFNEIGEQGNAEADIKLIDGDIVFVPERIF